MPYVQHHEVVTPPTSTEIWRYMDTLQFLVLLQQRALYFARLSELNDSWEGVLSRQLMASLLQAGPTLPALYKGLSYHMGVSCWHRNKSESVAMWSLYTSEGHGIAIKSTIGRLMESLGGNQQAVHIGEVLYRDHNATFDQPYPESGLNMYKAVFQKRECYRHECEVRAMALFVDPSINLPSTPPGTRIPPPAHGAPLKVDLVKLIEKVVLSASFPSWAQNVVEVAMKGAGLTVAIEASAMLQQPTQW